RLRRTRARLVSGLRPVPRAPRLPGPAGEALRRRDCAPARRTGVGGGPAERLEGGGGNLPCPVLVGARSLRGSPGGGDGGAAPYGGGGGALRARESPGIARAFGRGCGRVPARAQRAARLRARPRGTCTVGAPALAGPRSNTG